MSRGKSSKRRRNRSGKTPRWVLAAVGVLGIAAVVLVAVALNQPVQSSAAGGSHSAAVATVTDPAPTPSSPTAKRPLALLDDAARPFVWTVLGDSTGNGDHEWVYLIAQTMSDRFGRPVSIHNWDAASNTYTSESNVGKGANAPITIWNGSASGQSAAYTTENIAAIAPEPSDLVIVNHGYNLGSPQSAVSQVTQLRQIAGKRSPDASFAVTLQPPRVSSPETGAVQAGIVSALRQAFQPTVLIDVEAAYAASGDLAPLYVSDGIHPTDQGSIVWAGAVAAYLGL